MYIAICSFLHTSMVARPQTAFVACTMKSTVLQATEAGMEFSEKDYAVEQLTLVLPVCMLF